jgi:hypothetical protein
MRIKQKTSIEMVSAILVANTMAWGKEKFAGGREIIRRPL